MQRRRRSRSLFVSLPLANARAPAKPIAFLNHPSLEFGVLAPILVGIHPLQRVRSQAAGRVLLKLLRGPIHATDQRNNSCPWKCCATSPVNGYR